MKNIEILARLIDIQGELDSNDNFDEEYVLSLKREFNSLVKKIRKFFIHLEYDSPDDIIGLMIKKYNLPDDFAINKSRKRKTHVSPRQKAMVLCKYIFKNASLSEIGNFFGNKDHASVLHSIKTVGNLYNTDKKYRKEFDEMQLYFLGNIEIDFQNK